MTTSIPVTLGGATVAESVIAGPQIEAGASSSVGARRLRDMPEIWAAGVGTYLVDVGADGAVTLLPSAPIGGGSYHHAQLTASTQWTIPHGLGFNPAGIVLKDSAGDRIIPGDVNYLDPNTVRVTVGRATSGTAEVS